MEILLDFQIDNAGFWCLQINIFLEKKTSANRNEFMKGVETAIHPGMKGTVRIALNLF